MIKKESRLLRVGILGCGPIAQIAHFDACRKARNAELYAVCDIAEDLLARAVAVHEPTVSYRSYEKMLSDDAVEAVIIGTSDPYHVPLARQAIAAGKHVLVEKPLGVSVEECNQLQRELAQTRLSLQVGNNRRFDPGVAFARSFIDREIGQILAFKAWYCDSSYRYTMTDNLQPIPVPSSHARRPEENPKADRRRYFILTHASHLVDTARFLGGELLSVRARLAERFGAYCWFVEVEFSNGALGHLDLTIPIQGDFEEGFQIYGEGGSVAGKLFLPWFHKVGIVECFSVKDRQYHRALGEDAYTYKLQIEAFADTIIKGTAVRSAH